MLKKKIVDGYIEEVMFAQCIHGNKDLVQVCILLNAFFFFFYRTIASSLSCIAMICYEAVFDWLLL